FAGFARPAGTAAVGEGDREDSRGRERAWQDSGPAGVQAGADQAVPKAGVSVFYDWARDRLDGQRGGTVSQGTGKRPRFQVGAWDLTKSALVFVEVLTYLLTGLRPE